MGEVLDFVKFKKDREEQELESLKEDLRNWMIDPNYVMETITFTVEDNFDD